MKLKFWYIYYSIIFILLKNSLIQFKKSSGKNQTCNRIFLLLKFTFPQKNIEWPVFKNFQRTDNFK